MRFPTFPRLDRRAGIPAAPPSTETAEAGANEQHPRRDKAHSANSANSGKAAWASLTGFKKSGFKKPGFKTHDLSELNGKLRGKAKSLLNHAGKEFSIFNKKPVREYAVFSSTAHAGENRQFVDLSEEFDRPAKAPMAPPAGSRPGATQAQHLAQRLEQKFYASLNRVPRVARDAVQFETRAPEATNFNHQYATPAPAFQAKPTVRPIADFGAPVPNIGGGDCLFHALAGKNLSPMEVIIMRAHVADIKRRAPETGLTNAHHLAAALSQTPTLDFDEVLKLMDGRDSIPNKVYANHQAMPGTYAGEDELMQWTAIKDNREKVLVIDQDGTLALYSDGTKAVVAPEDLEQQVMRADIVLYKTPAHWEKIDKSPRWTATLTPNRRPASANRYA